MIIIPSKPSNHHFDFQVPWFQNLFNYTIIKITGTFPLNYPARIAYFKSNFPLFLLSRLYFCIVWFLVPILQIFQLCPWVLEFILLFDFCNVQIPSITLSITNYHHCYFLVRHLFWYLFQFLKQIWVLLFLLERCRLGE